MRGLPVCVTVALLLAVVPGVAAAQAAPTVEDPIARTLFDMKLSVGVAKIGTYVDQVVDVFYVVDQKGKKIDSTAKLNELRTRLLVEIEAWERSDAARQ